MSKEDNKQEGLEIPKVNTPAGISVEKLLEMFVATQKENAQNQKLLAEALLESRKPYVDPAVLEQKRLAGIERAAQIKLELRKRILTKAQCPHTRTESDMNGNLTFGEKLNIKWQEHSNGIIKGVCGTCFSEFDTRNPADLRLLQRDGKAVKNMGKARQNTHQM
jgi:hypothetical protein